MSLRLLLVAGGLATVLFSARAADALDFVWTGGATGDWFDAANWDQPFPPGGADRVLLTSGATAGPVTIDLGGATRPIGLIEASGVDTDGGAYTFENGTLQFFVSNLNAVLSNNNGGELVFNSDLLLNPGPNSTHIFNASTTGDKITVNGDVSSSQPTGITTLMLTSRNDSLPVAVEISGDVSDGAGRVQLVAGLNSDLANHTGVVRVTGDNTFTGSVAVNAATLEFDSIANVGGGPNALGQAPLADSTILLGTTVESASNSAALRYIGSGHSSNRVIRLNGDPNDSGVIASSGTGPLVLTGGIENPINGQTLHLSGTNADDNEIAGTIEDPLGGAAGGVTSILKSGSGRWILSGDSPELSNVFRANDGELVVRGVIGGGGGTVFSLATLADGTITLDDGSIAARGIQNAGTLNFLSGTVTLAGTNSTNGGSFGIGTNGAGTLRLNSGNHAFGDIAITGADDSLMIAAGTQTFSSLDNSAGGSLQFTGGAISLSGGQLTTAAGSLGGAISGTGGLTKIGPGELRIVAGVANSYTGLTDIQEGSLAIIGVGNALGATVVNVAIGATLDLSQTSEGETFGGLTGEGNVLLDQGADLGLSVTSGTLEFSGNATGDGTLTKVGAGTQVISGTVAIDRATTINTNGGVLEVATGGSLATSGITYRAATLAVTGGEIDTPGNIHNTSNAAVFSITGGLVKANAIDRTADSQYLSAVNWTGGTVHLLSPITISGSAITAIDRPFPGSVSLDDDMTLINDGSVTVSTGGALALNGGQVNVDTLLVSGAGAVTFNSGTMRLRSDQTLSAARLAELDVDSPLGAGRTLVIDGAATIEAPLTLAGGSLSAGSVVNPGGLILAGGVLTVTAGDLTIAPGETVDATSGTTIEVTSGGIVNDGELNAINAALSATGGVTNNGQINLINSTVDGDLINGPLGGAALLGSTIIGGDLDLSDASALILGVAGAADFDAVTVAGAAAVDGVLSVSLSGGFTPLAGQEFEVLSAASVTDEGLTLAGSAAGAFHLLIGADSVILRAVGGLAGDYNLDGRVDAADYTVWRDGLGATFTAAHYDTWRDNYGATAASGTRAVPEPSTALLALLACVASTRSRRRQAHPDLRAVLLPRL